MARPDATIHASAVLVGPKAVVIRGPSGSGKSRLAWDLLIAATQGLVPFARLVADDRAYLENHAGRLVVRPAQSLAGMIEIRGLGIRKVEVEPLAVVGLIVDLDAADGARHPEKASAKTVVEGVTLPRLGVAAGTAGLPLVLAAVCTPSASD